MTAIVATQMFRRSAEQRGEVRFPVALPATAVIDGEAYSVRVLNVAIRGAMFELSAPLATRSKLNFRCGTISVNATVAWQTEGRTGVSFDCHLSEREVREQLSRSAAVAARRELKLSSLGVVGTSVRT